MRRRRHWLAAALALVVALPPVARAGDTVDRSGPLRARTGGGNIVTHLTGEGTASLYEALHWLGARLGRVNSYGWRDLQRKPTPTDFDAAMLEAYRNGITPVVLLEYEGSYQFLDPPQPIGSYADWFAAGRATAERFRPGGSFAAEHGIKGWGATVFTAINEPDVQNTIPKDAYREALRGLADGVHSVDPALRVLPGGFASCNSHQDATLRGYGPAIRDLLEDGRLDGLDLHTYYHPRWFPITKDRSFSAQSCFDRIASALKLTRPINFYATEFNIARVEAWADPKLAAKLFLTALWDQFGVVGRDGRSSATVLAMPWYLADTGRIEGPAYAMAGAEGPWRPDPRADVLRIVLDLAGDMRFIELDPLHAGTFLLEGERGRLHVWQNLPGWTDRPGRDLTLDVPDWATRAEVWAWDGLRRRIPAVGTGRLHIPDLPAGETIMVYLPR